MTRRRILFMAEAVTLAHVARPYILAKALDPADYEVHFASDPRYEALFPDATLRHHALHTIAGSRFIEALAKGRPVYDTATLRGYVAEDLETIGRIAPDIVVGDFRLSLAVSAPLCGIPYLSICNAYWSPYAHPRFPVPELPITRTFGVAIAQSLFSAARPAAFALHTLPLNRVRREHGLPSLGWDLRTTYTWADHTLYADIPRLAPTDDLPPNHHYLGAVLWSPAVGIPDWWRRLPHDRPLIYVTLGSSGRVDLLPVILRALAEMPVTVIAATAGRLRLDPEDIPENVFLADYLPGDAASARAQMVICNGGSLTTQQALAHGVSVLGIPSNLDQHLNMQAIAGLGAGRLLRSERATVATVRTAVAAMTHELSYASAAGRLADEFVQYDAAQRFADLVSGVV